MPNTINYNVLRARYRERYGRPSTLLVREIMAFWSATEATCGKARGPNRLTILEARAAATLEAMHQAAQGGAPMPETITSLALSITGKIALVQKLRDDYDHGFLSPEGVRHFLSPFGVAGGTMKFTANPNDPKGLTLRDGATEAEGQDAATVAEMIATHLGCRLAGLSGRGFRLRHACDLAIKKLQEEQSEQPSTPDR